MVLIVLIIIQKFLKKHIEKIIMNISLYYTYKIRNFHEKAKC